MVQTVAWAPTAEATYNQIIDFLLYNWNKEIAGRFAKLVDEKIFMLRLHPTLGAISGKSGFRKVVLHENVELYYEYLPEQEVVKLRVFWDVRQNPQKLKF